MEVKSSGIQTLAKVNIENTKSSESDPLKETATTAPSADKITLSDDLIQTMGTGGGGQKPPPPTEKDG
jgi:hypothetical protein